MTGETLDVVVRREDMRAARKAARAAGLVPLAHLSDQVFVGFALHLAAEVWNAAGIEGATERAAAARDVVAIQREFGGPAEALEVYRMMIDAYLAIARFKSDRKQGRT